MADQKPPVLRMDCQWCGAKKHAINYEGERINQPEQEGALAYVTYDKPGVSLVCPRCDSPDVVLT